VGKKVQPAAEEPVEESEDEPATKPAKPSKEETGIKVTPKDTEEPESVKPRKAKKEDSDDEEGGFGDDESGENEADEGSDEEAASDEGHAPRVPIKVTLPDERWVISIKIDEIQEKLDLVDLQKVFGTYMTIKKKFFGSHHHDAWRETLFCWQGNRVRDRNRQGRLEPEFLDPRNGQGDKE
jgi:hypothetical protein